MTKLARPVRGAALALVLTPSLSSLVPSLSGDAAAQTYRDTGGTIPQSVVPLVGCSLNGNCAGPVSNSNPLPVSGTFSASLSGFQPTPAYTTLSVAATTSRAALPSGGVVVVYNTGPNAAYVTLGDSSVVATISAADVVQPNSWMAFTVGSNRYLAAIETAGTTSLTLSGGSGLPTGAGGGGAAGGGSVPTGPAGSPNASVVTIQGISGATAVKVDGSAVTQPVSASALPLPSNAAQENGGNLASVATNTTRTAAGASAPNALPIQGVAGGVAVPVSGAFWQATQPVSLASLPALATGSNTIGAVTQASGPWTINQTQINGSAVSTAAAGVQKVGVAGATGTALDSAAGTANGQAITVQGNASGIAIPVSGTFWQTTQPVSLASLPALAAGASTIGSVNQAGTWTITATQATGSNLHVVCDSGCSSSTAPSDESAFTAGTTSQSPVGGFYQTTATSNPLTSGQMGAWQMTANRAGFVNLRNSSGAEIGVAAAPVQVSLANTAANATPVKVDGSTVTQPVSGTFWQATQPVSLASLPALATGSNTIGAVTQASGPWTINQTQINGSAVSTAAAGVQKVGVAGATGTALDSAAGTANGQAITVQGNASGIAIPVSGTFWQTTQPVSLASLPALAAGASTIGSVNQAGTWTITATQATGSNLHVVCDSGCSSSTAPSDESAFTAGTTSQSPVGGFYQTTATSNPLTSGQMGAWQMTANRAGFVNLRNSSGAEIGVAAAPVQVSLANTAANATPVKVDGSTVTQPVSGTFWQATQPVSLASLPALATGSNTIGAVAQASGPWTINQTQINGSAVSTAAAGVQKVGVAGATGTALDSAAGTPNGQAITIQGNASGVAVPVSVSGVATAANQTTGNTSLSTIAGAVSASKMAVKAASGDFADGSIATLGAQSDTAYAGSGSASVVAALKGVYNALGTLNTTAGGPIPAGTNTIGSVNRVAATPIEKAGLTNTAVSVKASAGSLAAINCDNANTGSVIVEFFNTSSVTLGTTAPVWHVAIPAGGGGSNLPAPISLAGSAIYVAAVTAYNGSTAPTSTLNCAVGYF